MAAEQRSRVTTDVDFDKDGKQVGHLRVPHSRDSSGWGSLLVPIVSIKNGEGPTILFTGGNHGDEYEGPVALMKLVQTLEPAAIQGRVIVIPGLNFPALMAGKRLSPIDGKNMNRVFPGRRDGTITEIIAHYVQTEVAPLADAVFDLHSGGYSMFMVPYASTLYLDDPVQMAAAVAAVRAFRAPMAMVMEEIETEGTLDASVIAMGKVYVGTELGGGGVLTPETVAIAETGIRNVLIHFGVMEGEPVTAAWRGRTESRMMEVPSLDNYVMAMAEGIYEPLRELRDAVEAGAAVGQIHFVDALAHAPMVLTANASGVLFCRRAPGRVEKGDVVAVVARDAQNLAV